MSQVFIVQVSGSPADRSQAETKADEPIQYGFYNHPDWHNQSKDEDFEKVTEGDIILLYCTANVEESPKQIKFIYRARGKEEDRTNGTEVGVPNKIHLELERELSPGFPLENIRQWVEDGKLTDSMNRAGTQGFNITHVSEADYEAIVDWASERDPEPSIEHYEEELRTYIAEVGLSALGPQYSNYELYEDNEGNVGELYTTPLGEIDLLYRNADTGKYVVVELKRTEDTSDRVVGQIARYIGWVDTELTPNSSVHGLIVAQTASQRLKYAVEALNDCELATYQLDFQFRTE